MNEAHHSKNTSGPGDDALAEGFHACSQIIAELPDALVQLQRQAKLLQVSPLESLEWFELLRQKLSPQLGSDSWLVVAVVGGTNIGKSVVFNHLAGSRASASSPLASGTKHPVCLVPQGFSSRHDLQRVFPDFQLQEWRGESEALQESERHQLYWRTAPQLPSALLVLDTPDIDSDARVNWIRADAVRRSADVLVAVLTQQKYNDAAVKEFFRKAGAEDKAIIIVFNQCLLPDDENYWPVWLKTFCEETNIVPDAVFIAPADRRAAEEQRLPFFERPWPVPDGWGPASVAIPDPPRSLSDELAQLRFPEIRMRTLLGSLRELLHEQHGVNGWLRELRAASSELAITADRLSSETVLRIRDWPLLSNGVVVEHIRSWWQTRQQGWARRVNGFYRTVGAGLMWPVRAARNAIQGPPVPALDEYRQREWSAVLEVVEETFDKLQWMSDTGNPMIQPRIQALLQGASRTDLITRLRNLHNEVDFETEFSDVLNRQMERLQQDSPDLFRFYRQLNNVSAAVRPLTSVVLFSVGFGPAGEAVAPFVADAAAQAVVHVVADVAGGATAALAGEAAVAGAAGSGASLLQAWFHRLHAAFTERRVAWLTRLIHSELLGTLPEELQAAARLTDTDQYRHVRQLVDRLQGLMQKMDSGSRDVAQRFHP